MDVYEKINKAVTVCSAIKTLRGSSPSIPVKTRPNSSENPKSFITQKGKAVEKPKPIPATYIANHGQVTNTEEGKKLEMQIEDSFTDYINRVKIKMSRTISNISTDVPMPNNISDHGKNASAKDEFSEYLDRARIKIRTTSSIGGGNSQIF
ncbi:hypothetical protein JCGZ_21979 [Jatropha curcas]|uniref:Uncharacterized protein n=1 Tax=Jatropha curcas TaxID=180498 RepID=A0A067JFE4_JATCU|nr:hypothetical protein JCGZ_21979 [Jatropha curcas]